MKKIPNDKRALPYGSAFAVADPETLAILDIPLDLTCLSNNTVVDRFLSLHAKWVQSTVKNTITGLDRFKFRCYSNGTSESFDKFYMKNKNRRFRCFRGEYLYHSLAWRNGYNWQFIDEQTLDMKENDALVISLPFADTGNCHSLYTNTLNKCNKLGIPVLVDCAYFGVCQNITFDFTHPAITDVVFSLSKAFPVAYARIGIRYSIEDTDDTLFVYQKIDYVNKIGASLGIRYLQNFSPDYISDKYKEKQLAMCAKLTVEPSNTVLFGLGDNKWNEYNRGGEKNRLSFHKQYIAI